MLIIDSREASQHPSVVKSLSKIFEVKVESLPSGDFYISGAEKDCVIERKTVFDFLNSIGGSGRIWEQLLLMNSYEGGVQVRIVLEGYWGLYRKRKWKEASIYSQLDSIVEKWKVPIIPTPDIRGTLSYISWKATSLQTKDTKREYALRGSASRSFTPLEGALYVLQGFPLISTELSHRILEKYGTLWNALYNVRQWKHEIKGVAEGKQGKVVKILHAQYEKNQKS